MSTYLLTWNPNNWSWDALSGVAEKTRMGGPHKERWSTGKRKDIRKGDRVFLIRLGQEPKGIMGAGTSLGTCKEDDHWDGTKVKKALYIPVSFERLLDPEADELLDVANIKSGPLSAVHWGTQASGISIPDVAAELLEDLWAEHLGQADRASAEVMTDADAEAFPEGKIVFRRHRLRERDPEVIAKAKSLAMKREGKLCCCVCGFDFAAQYGRVGEGFIEGHHTKPLSELVGETETTIADIALVCSNCHRMLHRRRPWLSATELGSLVKGIV